MFVQNYGNWIELDLELQKGIKYMVAHAYDSR